MLVIDIEILIYWKLSVTNQFNNKIIKTERTSIHEICNIDVESFTNPIKIIQSTEQPLTTGRFIQYMQVFIL